MLSKHELVLYHLSYGIFLTNDFLPKYVLTVSLIHAYTCKVTTERSPGYFCRMKN